ncbi:Ribosomal-protein-alanine acetyltransferase [Mycena kentingensis (nom. inval.)]|nr:Ribosomal-protein-alanine acetyltransferase [Mycena kentingensis (nom. inval.)]
MPMYPVGFTLEQTQERRQKRAGDSMLVDFAIYTTTDAAQYVGAVGLLNLNDDHKTCEGGIAVVPDAYRGGVATDATHSILQYAFEEWGMNASSRLP